jgi:hypothetical protein
MLLYYRYYNNIYDLSGADGGETATDYDLVSNRMQFRTRASAIYIYIYVV